MNNFDILPSPSDLLSLSCSDLSTCFQSIYNILFMILLGLAFFWFLFGAFEYLLSASGYYSIQKAKSRMISAILAVVIVLIIPPILYLIDPNIFNITLKIPDVKVKAPEAEFKDSAELSEEEIQQIWRTTTTNQQTGPITSNLPSSRPFNKSDLVPIKGIKGIVISKPNMTIHKDLLIPLAKAGKIAQNMGYKIMITSAFRSYQRQVELWNHKCKSLVKENRCSWEDCRRYTCREARKWVAPPGHSPHEIGRAIDVALLLNNKNVTHKSYQNHQHYRKVLEDILCQAGWVRYEQEWWHFEHGTKRWKKGIEERKCAT